MVKETSLEQTAVEEKMTPAERSLFEKYKKHVGHEFSLDELASLFNYGPGQKNWDEIGRLLCGWGRDATWSYIKKFAVANDDFNALWFDEEYAKNSKWGGLTAPPLYLVCVENYAYLWRALASRTELFDPDYGVRRDKYPNWVSPFEAGAEWEFFEPVRPGDTIDYKVKPVDVYWKQGKQYRLLFFVEETTYTNQKGQLVARCRGSAVYRWK